MRRCVVLALIASLAIIPTGAPAQGLFDGSFLGFGQYFGLGGETSGCGGEVKPISPCVFYVGYSGDPGSSTGFSSGAEGQGVGTIVELSHHYAVRGLWLGASKTLALSDNIGVVGSFWYLFPDKTVTSRETYFSAQGAGLPNERTWDTNSQWWYGDLLGALGPLNGFSLLAGFRYDFFTTRFRNPFNASFPASRGTDTADVRSNGYIPLVGGQVAYAGSYGSLLFRLVGVPTLVGRVIYNQTLEGLRIESTGNYNGGHFIEAFADYAYAVNGRADLGLFARYNSTHGTTQINIDVVDGGSAVVANDTFRLGVYRNDWTVGGRVNLRF